MTATETITPDDPRAFTETVAERIAERDSDTVVGLISGGNDSTGMGLAIAASEQVDFDVLAHCNTGIGVEQTREYVRKVAAYLDTPYMEGLSPVKDRFASILMGKPQTEIDWGEVIENPESEVDYGSGHPGATSQSHFPVQERLKGRVRDAIVQAFPGEVVLVSGARRSESDKRWSTVPATGIEISDREGREYVWASPCANWTGSDVTEILRESGLDRNEVADLLGMSGECLCFSYGTIKTLKKVAALEPETAIAYACLVLHVNAWWERFPEGEKPWPRQRLIPGHGNVPDRELRQYLDGPLMDEEDCLSCSEPDPEAQRDPEQRSLNMCGACMADGSSTNAAESRQE